MRRAVTCRMQAFSLLETLLMLLLLGVFTMALAGLTRPLWWHHAQSLLGKDSPSVEAAAKK